MKSLRQERFNETEIKILDEFYDNEPNSTTGKKVWSANHNVIQAIRRHVLEGQPTGRFVDEALKNNFDAVACGADDWMRDVLPALGSYLRKLPIGSWKSNSKVQEWKNEGGYLGMTKAPVEGAVYKLKRKGI